MASAGEVIDQPGRPDDYPRALAIPTSTYIPRMRALRPLRPPPGATLGRQPPRCFPVHCGRPCQPSSSWRSKRPNQRHPGSSLDRQTPSELITGAPTVSLKFLPPRARIIACAQNCGSPRPARHRASRHCEAINSQEEHDQVFLALSPVLNPERGGTDVLPLLPVSVSWLCWGERGFPAVPNRTPFSTVGGVCWMIHAAASSPLFIGYSPRRWLWERRQEATTKARSSAQAGTSFC